MANPGLAKSFISEAAIAAHRIVKFGSGDDKVLQGAAVSDALIGVANNLGGEITKRVDVIVDDLAEVEYGGNITRGGYLTSDADGKAVAAAPAAGVNNRVIGIAMVSGVAGDIGTVLICPTQIQG